MRILLFFCFLSAAFAADVPLKEEIQFLQTKDGTEYGIWGRRDGVAQPTLIILAATIRETLGSNYFRQCGTRMARENGWLCVSIDIPAHGKDVREGETPGLAAWRSRIEKGEDFVKAGNARLSTVLDDLIARGYTDANRIAACGTSRGGFLAIHFAASDARVKAAAGFAPVTDLAVVREFTAAAEHPLLKELSLLNLPPKLADRAVWIGIGDRDERVSTDLAIELARGLSKAGARAELHVFYEPKGHTTPAGCADLVATWIPAQVK